MSRVGRGARASAQSGGRRRASRTAPRATTHSLPALRSRPQDLLNFARIL